MNIRSHRGVSTPASDAQHLRCLLHSPTCEIRLCCTYPPLIVCAVNDPPHTHTHTRTHVHMSRTCTSSSAQATLVTNSFRLACVCALQGEVERLQFDLQAKESQSKDSMSQLLMAGQQQQVRMSSTVNASIIGCRRWQR
jgi:hypothetical protein